MRRRDILAGLGALTAREAVGAPVPWLSPELTESVRAGARLARKPGKQPLIQLSDRPPNLETPIQFLGQPATANDQFFVRYHHAAVPGEGARDDWALDIGGDAAERNTRLRFSQLKDLPQAEVTAVCQCAGNRRGLLNPHVAGLQWGHGAMGCATWHGPRLRDVLNSAGMKPEAVEIWFEGADRPAMAGPPLYRKSLPLSKAMADETIVATEMNNAPLPLLNGFPARLVVPGWAGAYWMKHLTRMTISATPLDEFWMRKAYRVPSGVFPATNPFPAQDAGGTSAITDIVVNSLIVTPVDGDQVERPGVSVRGVAWDAGAGIRRVDVSLDDGRTWQSALLDREIGPYAFRNWRLETGPVPRGNLVMRVRASNNVRETQPNAWRANPGGYHNNVPQRLTVRVV